MFPWLRSQNFEDEDLPRHDGRSTCSRLPQCVSLLSETGDHPTNRFMRYDGRDNASKSKSTNGDSRKVIFSCAYEGKQTCCRPDCHCTCTFQSDIPVHIFLCFPISSVRFSAVIPREQMASKPFLKLPPICCLVKFDWIPEADGGFFPPCSRIE